MKKLLLILFILTLISLNGYSQIYLNWQRFTDGTAHLDDSAVAVDVEETATNVYIGGNIYNSETLSDIEIKNYDLNGNLVWKTGYASSYNDHLAEFLCDAAMTGIYGAGNSDNGSYLIGLLIKMDMKGNLLWSRTFTGGGNISFENIKVAPNGNIIVVGEMMLSLFLCDEIVACYDVNGNLLWSHTGTEQSGENEFNDLAIDGSGKIYASGYKYNGTNKDGYIAKYNANGKLLNSATINGAGNKDDEVKGISFFNGILYAATVGRGSDSYDEVTTTAYNPADFSVVWSKNYSSVNGDAGIIGPEINETTGDIILAGVQGNFTNGTSDYLALSYNGITGNLNWAKTTSRGSGYNNIATALTVDAAGNLLITGETNLAGAAVDMFTVEYDHLGNLLWTKVFNGAVNGDDYPTAIGADANGNIFVAGTSAQSTSSAAFLKQGKNNQDFALLKYSSKFICSVPTNLFSDSITSSFARLNWDVMPEAIKYKLQYRLVGGSWISMNVTNHNKIITGLASKTKYQWRVKTICSTNPSVSSDYSVIKSFYTLGSGFASSFYNAADEAAAAKQTGLHLFPNPATQMVNLQLNGISESNLEVKLNDVAGKELKHYQFATSSKTFNHQIDISSLSPGSYIIEIIGSKQKWSQVLIKQ
jgi:type IX secretion system substrate protein/putative pyrroloquinoline-quinone binding quinoprotein